MMIPEDSLRKDLLDNIFEGVYFVDSRRVITYWSTGTEKLTGFSADEVVGRSCQDNISMYVDKWGHSLCDTGMCPAMQTMRDGYIREINVSYHHKEGHLVPALARFLPVRDSDGNIQGVVEVFQDVTPVERWREKTRELEKLALTDPLTSVANRACAEARLDAKLNELRRYSWPFGVLFCDVDKFKNINDTYGHDAGDQVLRAVARTLAGNLRTSDFVCRWGGDEFLVVLQNVNAESMERVSDKIRRLIDQCRVHVGPENDRKTLRVSSSMGGTLALPEDTLESLLKRVDEAMYRDKKTRKDSAGE